MARISNLSNTTSTTRRALVLTLACAAMAMVGIDTAIVNVAVPSIQHDLGITPSASQWVVVAYGLVLGGFLLFGGRLTDHLGRRRIFVSGLAVFTAASLVAGAAQGAGLLIAARAVQGFGAALVAPAALSLLAVTFAEGRDRDRAFGIFGAVGGVAGSVGVVASGLLTAGPGWRWAFFINVPVGTVAIALALAFLVADRPAGPRHPARPQRRDHRDRGLLLLVYALHHAANHGLVTGSALALFAAAAAVLAAFVRIEARSEAPLVPTAILRNRSVVAANLAAFLAFAALLSFIFIGSLLMQQALGYSPTKTGLAWLSTTMTVFVAAMAAPAGRTDAGAMAADRRSVGSHGRHAVADSIAAEASYVVDLLPAFLLVGIGFGLCGPALQIGALSGVAQTESGLASGLVETMREVGGAAGVAVVSTVLVAGSGLAGFHQAFAFIGVLAGLGVVVAAAGFARERPSPSTCDAPESRLVDLPAA